MATYPTDAEANEAISPEMMDDLIADLPEYHRTQTMSAFYLENVPEEKRTIALAAYVNFAHTLCELGGSIGKNMEVTRLATHSELREAAIVKWKNAESERRRLTGE